MLKPIYIVICLTLFIQILFINGHVLPKQHKTSSHYINKRSYSEQTSNDKCICVPIDDCPEKDRPATSDYAGLIDERTRTCDSPQEVLCGCDSKEDNTSYSFENKTNISHEKVDEKGNYGSSINLHKENYEHQTSDNTTKYHESSNTNSLYKSNNYNCFCIKELLSTDNKQSEPENHHSTYDKNDYNTASSVDELYCICKKKNKIEIKGDLKTNYGHHHIPSHINKPNDDSSELQCICGNAPHPGQISQCAQVTIDAKGEKGNIYHQSGGHNTESSNSNQNQFGNTDAFSQSHTNSLTSTGSNNDQKYSSSTNNNNDFGITSTHTQSVGNEHSGTYGGIKTTGDEYNSGSADTSSHAQASSVSNYGQIVNEHGVHEILHTKVDNEDDKNKYTSSSSNTNSYSQSQASSSSNANSHSNNNKDITNQYGIDKNSYSTESYSSISSGSYAHSSHTQSQISDKNDYSEYVSYNKTSEAIVVGNDQHSQTTETYGNSDSSYSHSGAESHSSYGTTGSEDNINQSTDKIYEHKTDTGNTYGTGLNGASAHSQSESHSHSETHGGTTYGGDTSDTSQNNYDHQLSGSKTESGSHLSGTYYNDSSHYQTSENTNYGDVNKVNSENSQHTHEQTSDTESSPNAHSQSESQTESISGSYYTQNHNQNSNEGKYSENGQNTGSSTSSSQNGSHSASNYAQGELSQENTDGSIHSHSGQHQIDQEKHSEHGQTSSTSSAHAESESHISGQSTHVQSENSHKDSGSQINIENHGASQTSDNTYTQSNSESGSHSSSHSGATTSSNNYNTLETDKETSGGSYNNYNSSHNQLSDGIPKDYLGCGYPKDSEVAQRVKNDSPDSESLFGQYPWMVAILSATKDQNDHSKISNVFLCGGSLIHPKVVLTATHCIIRKDEKNMVVRAGEWNAVANDEILPYQQEKVEKIIRHPDYYSGGLHNDLSLIFIEKPFKFADNVDIICLPPSNLNIDYSDKCIVSGWGKSSIDKSSKYQEILRQVDLPLVPNHDCEEKLKKTRLGQKFKLHDSFICAGGEVGKDTCKGDGGGPLICPIKGSFDRYHQLGIVSWGIGCGTDTPAVYVNVKSFRSWIDQELHKAHLKSHYEY